MEDVKSDYDFTVVEINLLYPMFLSWLDIHKSIILGRTIAEILPRELIPTTFKEVIKVAVEVSKNV